jgi:predicted 3-demethylubiquinone-9 3-methyltransferase (glyoxalase superfamily)
MVSGSNFNHAWSFTPWVSLFVVCNSEDERQTLFEKLSTNDRQIMVLLDNYAGSEDYGFGKKFGWCEDTYGISWQLNLSE